MHCPVGLNVLEDFSEFIKLNFWSKLALCWTNMDQNKILEDNSNIKFYWNPSNSLRYTKTPPLHYTFLFWALCQIERIRALRHSCNCSVFYLLQVLFRELRLTASKLSFKFRRPSTSKEALMQIKHDHPLPEIILQWRKLNSVVTKVVKKIGDLDRIDSYVRQ